MKLVKAYIIDDDQASLNLLKKMLEENYSVEVTGTSNSPAKGIEEIMENVPDLLFLDIEMPNMTGLEVSTAIASQIPQDIKIVFYTGYDKYMIDAIRHQAFDYLLKPLQAADLSIIMNRYYENRLTNIRQVSYSPQQIEQPILVVNDVNEHLALKTNDIAYFRYNLTKKVWEIISFSNNIYTLRHRTSADVILAHSKSFVQIHKRFIVNINHINKIQDNTCYFAGALCDVTELKISKNYKRNLMDSFYDM